GLAGQMSGLSMDGSSSAGGPPGLDGSRGALNKRMSMANLAAGPVRTLGSRSSGYFNVNQQNGSAGTGGSLGFVKSSAGSQGIPGGDGSGEGGVVRVMNYGVVKSELSSLVVDLQAVTISIANVESELTEVDWLLQMEESDWPRTAQLKYGDHPTLRQEKIDLRQEKKDLRRKEAYLLKEKEQLNAMKLLEKELGRVMLESSPVVPPIQSPLTEHDGPAKLFIPNTADNTLRGYFHRNNAEGETFSKFMTVAVGLQNDPSLLAIVHKINSIPKEWSNLNTPFVFLEGSSGTGKTQTAFALLNLLAASTQVLYFLYLPVGEHAQPIYKCFQAVSKLFNACADKDQNMLDSPSCGSLIELDLHLFGFILAFLQNCGSSNHTQVIIGDQVEIKSVKGSVVKDYLRSNYSTKSLPV
ncbi:hypothetical protein HDU99_001703, partial [Rhizoclosmatium hyalinum]